MKHELNNPTNEISLRPVLEKIESLFSIFNSRYFNGELVKPLITLSPDMTSGAYGWCTTKTVWHDDNASYYEINITAEHLSRTFSEVGNTLLHEMCHLYNAMHNIKDYSRGGTFHNKRFKEAAESHGLIVKKTDKYGYSSTKLTEDAFAVLVECGFSHIDLHREAFKKKNKVTHRQSTRKYVCPICGTIIRATKKVAVICSDCNVLFIEE